MTSRSNSSNNSHTSSSSYNVQTSSSHTTPSNTTMHRNTRTSSSIQQQQQQQQQLLQRLDQLWQRDRGSLSSDIIATLETIVSQVAPPPPPPPSHITSSSSSGDRQVQAIDTSANAQIMRRVHLLKALCSWLHRNRVHITSLMTVDNTRAAAGGGGSRLAERLWYNTRHLLTEMDQTAVAMSTTTGKRDASNENYKLIALQVIQVILQKRQQTPSATTTTTTTVKNAGYELAIDEDESWIPMRVDMFHFIRDQCRDVDNVPARIRALRLISGNGVHIVSLGPRQFVDLVIEMTLLRCRTTEERMLCCGLLNSTLHHRFTAVVLASEQQQLLVSIIECMARLIWSNLSPELSETALSVLETVVDNGVSTGTGLPPKALVPLCSTFCHTINIDHLSNRSATAMRSLLSRTVVGARAFQVLLDIMMHSNHVALFRGAVFFVGTARWGPRRIESVQDSFSFVLLGMHKVLSSQDLNVAYEVMLNIRRLLKKYGKELHSEWDMIIQIMLKMEPIVMDYLSKTGQGTKPFVKNTMKDPQTSPSPLDIPKKVADSIVTSETEIQPLSLDQVMRDVIDMISQQFEERHYYGTPLDFFTVVQTFKGICTERTCMHALKQMQEFLHPALSDWPSTLKLVFTTFFENEAHRPLRLQALEMLASFLWKYGHVIGEEAFGKSLRYVQRSMNNPGNDLVIQTRIVEIVVDVIKELKLSDTKFTEFAHMLAKTIATDGVDVSIQLFAVSGLVDTFLQKFDKLPCSETITLFDSLMTLLSHEQTVVREKVIHTLKHMHANQLYQIGIKDRISPYIKCHSQHMIRTISHVLPISSLVDVLLERIRVEQDHHIFLLLLQTLEGFLYNTHILKDTSIARLCTSLCTIFQERIEYIVSPELQEHNSDEQMDIDQHSTFGKATATTAMLLFDCCKTFIALLRLLSGYSRDLGAHQKNLLVKSMILALHRILSLTNFEESEEKLEDSTTTEGIPPSPMSLCDQLIVACLESMNMLAAECCEVLVESQHTQFVMHALGLLHQHAAQLPEAVIVSMLELLNFLGINCPESKRSSMIQHCFEICLTCTDNNQFSHYVILVSYRVLITWFIRCTFLSRQQLIKMCLPVLYGRVRSNKCTLAETAIDFLIKYAYLSSEQNFTMTDQLRKIFDNHSYKAWSVGNSILTAQSGMFNYVILRFRRPTGTIAWTMKLLNSIHHHQPHGDVLDQEEEEEEENSFGEDMMKMIKLGDSASSVVTPAGREDANSITQDDGNLSHHKAIHNFGSYSSSDFPLTSTSLESILNLSLDQHDTYLSIARNPLPILHESDTPDLLHEIGDLDLDFGEATTDFTEAEGYLPDVDMDDEQQIDKDVMTQDHAALGEISRQDDAVKSLDQPTTIGSEQTTENQYAMQFSYGIGEAIPSILQQEDDNESDVMQYDPDHAEEVASITTTTTTLSATSDVESLLPLETRSSIDSTSPIAVRRPTINFVTPTTPVQHAKDRSDDDDAKERRKALPRRAISMFNIPKLDLLDDTMDEEYHGDGITSITPRNTRPPPFLTTRQHQQRNDKRSSQSPLPNVGRSRSMSIDPRRPPLSMISSSSSSSSSARAIPGDSKKRASLNRRLHAGLEKLSMSLGAVGKSTGRNTARKRISSPIFKPLSAAIGAASELREISRDIGQQQQQQDQQQSQQSQSVIHPNFPYLFLRNWAFLSQEEPRGLKVDPSLTRSLHVLDLIPSYETSKFAVLFVAEGQSREEEILSNTHGTPSYFKFLKELGEFVSLNELDNAYSGGLDKSENKTDGQYALIYKDETIYIVFHVATMMPNSAVDGKLDHKKRHIGNDYVTIVYSETDQPSFNSGIITGQFNFVHIVVYPLLDGLNRVEICVRKDIAFPKFGPLPRVQIVSDRALPGTVRLTALHADLAVRAWRKARGESISNWDERLRQIGIIKSRHWVPGASEAAASVQVSQESHMDTNLMRAMHDFFD